MWGSTTPNTVDECNWESYTHCNRSYDTLTKYCTNSKYGTEDNKTTLESEDDAATQIMGGDWRMPTKAEIQELIDNTTKEWTKVNGVSGRKFTSKADTSKYIFIPGAGSCRNGSVFNVGNSGSVWSSSLNDLSNGNAYSLNFDSDSCYMSNYKRCYGYVVRGVRK